MALGDTIDGYNSRNFVRIDLNGSANMLTCCLCGMTQRVLIKDEFIPYSVMIYSKGREYTRVIKTNKKAIEHFIDEHKARHFLGVNQTFMERQLRKQKENRI